MWVWPASLAYTFCIIIIVLDYESVLRMVATVWVSQTPNELLSLNSSLHFFYLTHTSVRFFLIILSHILH